MQDFSLIICSAGKSQRFGTGEKKEYLALSNFYTEKMLYAYGFVSVLSENIAKFLKVRGLQNIVILIPKGDEDKIQNLLQQDNRIKDVCTFINADDLQSESCIDRQNKLKVYLVEGGETRQASVFNALNFLVDAKLCHDDESVLIHDAARPFFSLTLIENILQALKTNRAVVPSLKVVDTQKQVDSENYVRANLQRDSLRAVQTPQGFYLKEIYEAHKAAKSDINYTDDSEVFFVHFPNVKILTIEGELTNKKITYASDRLPAKDRFATCNFRVGFGYDIHRLVEGKELMIGGVRFEYDKGFLAHSDGDVLLHAITDALLGATGFSDIGELFPPSDDEYKGVDSKVLLKKAWTKCTELTNWQIQNIDCVLIMEVPKFLPYRKTVIKSIAEVLSVSPNCIFVKAKTSEKLGAVGRGEAIEAFATALVYKN